MNCLFVENYLKTIDRLNIATGMPQFLVGNYSQLETSQNNWANMKGKSKWG